MLRMELRVCKVNFAQPDVRLIFKTLSESGTWLPASFEAQGRFAQLASMPVDQDLRFSTRTVARRLQGMGEIQGDVFFREDSILFLVNVHSENPSFEQFRYEFGLDGVREISEVALSEGGLLIGIATTLTDYVQILDEFSLAVAEAIRSSFDGRKIRYMKLDWEPVSAERDLFDSLRERLAAEGIEPAFSRAELSPELSLGAQVLADKSARGLIRELSEAGFAREADVLTRRGRKEDEVRAALGSLKDAGLVVTEHLLTCRHSTAPLTRITDPAELENPIVGNLRCGKCNRTYNQELLSEGHSLSGLGQGLSRGNHWMTVWVAERLTELGAPLEAQYWNIEESGEEVDIILSFLGRLWIFELKDRDFSAGDAHPFNYRRVRYRADEAVIITTGKVMPDAKRVFEDLSGGSRRGGAGGRGPTFIEGLANVTPGLRDQFDTAALRRAMSVLRLPSAITGYDLEKVLRSKTEAKLPDGAA